MGERGHPWNSLGLLKIEQHLCNTIQTKHSPDNGWCMNTSLNKVGISAVKKTVPRQDAKTRNPKNCWQAKKSTYSTIASIPKLHCSISPWPHWQQPWASREWERCTLSNLHTSSRQQYDQIIKLLIYSNLPNWNSGLFGYPIPCLYLLYYEHNLYDYQQLEHTRFAFLSIWKKASLFISVLHK